MFLGMHVPCGIGLQMDLQAICVSDGATQDAFMKIGLLPVLSRDQLALKSERHLMQQHLEEEGLDAAHWVIL